MINNMLIIIIAVSLLLFLLLKEIRRLNKARLYLRLLCSVIAVASLACIALPITMLSNKNSIGQKQMLLLTEGYNKDSVDVFQKNKNIQVYQADSLLTADGDSLYVFGYGLSKYKWQQLKPAGIDFHPSPLSAGITSVHWDQQLQAGHVLKVQGSFNNTSADTVTLLLSAYNMHLDSVSIQPGVKQNFQLQAIPKHLGQAVYSLIAKFQGKLIAEPLPVNVSEQAKLNVLMLAASPDFENKFLSRWLSQNGCTVVLRTAVSKGKYAESFLDTSKFKIDHIDPALLNRFDLMVADASVLTALSNSELESIKKQVADKGFGLVIKADTSLIAKRFYNESFDLSALPNSRITHNMLIRGIDKPVRFTEEQAAYIKSKDDLQPLVTNESGNLFIAAALYGSGKILMSTLSQTYTLALAGQQSYYQSLWSSVLEEAALQKNIAEHWSIKPFIPRVDEPVGLFVQTNATIPIVTIENSKIAFLQNKNLAYEWNGTYWPRTDGWQHLVSSNDSLYWYTFKETDWKNIALQQRTSETYAYAKSIKDHSLDKSETPNKKPFPKIIFFFTLLAACTFLWIERKL